MYLRMRVRYQNYVEKEVKSKSNSETGCNCSIYNVSPSRSVFGLKSEEVTGSWRKLHTEELHNLCPRPSIIWNDKIKANEMGRTCRKPGRVET
jgi:hypothetical protein